MNRYEILINKQDQYFNYADGCSCVHGCWRLSFINVSCLFLPEFIDRTTPFECTPDEPVQLPIERSESKWKTAEIKSTAFAVNIDFSQISGLRKPSTKELDSLRQSMRTRQQRAMMSAFGVTSQS